MFAAVIGTAVFAVGWMRQAMEGCGHAATPFPECHPYAPLTIITATITLAAIGRGIGVLTRDSRRK